MNHMKRLGALLLAAILVLSLVPVTALANTEGENSETPETTACAHCQQTGEHATDCPTRCVTPEACVEGHVSPCPLASETPDEGIAQVNEEIAPVVATGLTLTASAEKVVVGNPVTLTVAVTPADAQVYGVAYLYVKGVEPADGDEGTAIDEANPGDADFDALRQSCTYTFAEAGTYTCVVVQKISATEETYLDATCVIEVVEPAAKIGETGYATLRDAASAVPAGGTATITLADGDHKFPEVDMRNKNITFSGSRNAKLDATGLQINYMQILTGATLTFNGITVNWADNNTGYQGPANAKKVVYNNCAITGTQFMYGDADFTNCAFESYSGYSVYGRGAGTLNFSNCTFASRGRAIMLYADDATNVTANLTNCTFTSTGSQSKAAVEAGEAARGRSKFQINFNNCSADSGYVANTNGVETGSNLWGNKNNMSALYLSVTIDGANAYTPKVSVDVGNQNMDNVTPVEAVNAAAAAKKPIVVEDDKAIENLVDAAIATSKAVEIQVAPAATTTNTASDAAVAAVAQSTTVALTLPVTVAEDTASVKLDNSVVQNAKTIAEQTASKKADISLTVEKADDVPADETATEYEINMTVGGVPVSNLGGTATVTLPLPAGVTDPVVYFRNDAGIKCYLASGVSKVGDNVIYSTNHFSKWGVGEKSDLTPVAQVGDYLFDNLQEAIDFAPNNSGTPTKVTLLTNVTINSVDYNDTEANIDTQFHFDSGDNVIVDLGGNQVTGAFFVKDGATVTIQNGTIAPANTVSCVESQGNLTIHNITATSSRHGIRISKGDATIGGDKTVIRTTGSNTKYAVNGNGSNLITINDGKFYGPGKPGSGNGAVNAMGNNMVINNGEFINDGGEFNIAFYSGNLTINDGIFHGTTKDTICIGGGKPDYGTTTEYGIKGGIFENLTTSDNALLSKNCAFAEITTGIYQGWDEVAAAIAKVTGDPDDKRTNQGGYISLQAAIEAVQSNQVIQLLADISTEQVILGKSVTLDLNGKTVTNPITLTAKGITLTIQDTVNDKNTLTVKNGRENLTILDTNGEPVSGNIALGVGTHTPSWGYTVTIDPNGGQVDGNVTSITPKEDNGPTMPATTKTGYTLTSWVITPAGGTATKYLISDTIPALNKIASAVAEWTANKYKITYEGATADSTWPSEHTYNVDTDLSAAVPTKVGHTFDGWYTNAQFTGEKLTKLGGTDYTADITLYAKWTLKQYTVTFDANGGKLAGDKDVIEIKGDYESTVTKPADPSRDGYTFIGWTDSTNTVVAPITTMPAENTTYKAKWEAITYTITYNANDNSAGNEQTKSENYTYDEVGEIIANPFEAPLQDNGEPMNFVGWNTQTDGNGTAYAPGTKVNNWTTTAENYLTLYAQWAEAPAPTFTITKDEFTYNGQPQGIEYTVEPENATVTVTYTLANTRAVASANAPTNAGTYDVTVTVAASGYSTTSTVYPGGLTINKAPLTATYAGETVYGGHTPKLAVTVTGFQGTDTADTIAGYAAPEIDKTTVPTTLGKHYLEPTGGTPGANYYFAYAGGDLIIKEKVVYVYNPDKLLQTGAEILPIALLVIAGIAVMTAGVWLQMRRRNGYER